MGAAAATACLVALAGCSDGTGGPAALLAEGAFVAHHGARCSTEWEGVLPVGGLGRAWAPELEAEALAWCSSERNCGGVMRYIPPAGETLEHTNCHLWCGRPQFCHGPVSEHFVGDGGAGASSAPPPGLGAGRLKPSERWLTLRRVDLDGGLGASSAGGTAGPLGPHSWASWAASGSRAAELPPSAGEPVYDFVVVGGGSGGCAAAARLAKGGASVLLLEVGARPPPGLADRPWQPSDPINRPDLWFTARVDLQGGGPRLPPLQAGRVLGGTSALNGRVYTRGPLSAYEADLGWRREDVRAAFEDLEANLGNLSLFSAERSELPPLYGVVADAFSAALGVPYRVDPHAGGDDFSGEDHAHGFGGRWSFQASGNGESARTLYKREMFRRERVASTALVDSVSSTNLFVATEALALRLIFDEAGVVQGVLARDLNRSEEVRLWARREVILSAGVLGTSQVLLMSGIGDALQLRRLGVPPLLVFPDFGRVRVDWGVEMLIRFKAPCPTNWQRSSDPGGPLGFSFFAFLNATFEEVASSSMARDGGVGGGLLDAEVQLLELCADGRAALRLHAALLRPASSGRLAFLAPREQPEGPAVVSHGLLAPEDLSRLYDLVRKLFDRIIFHPVLKDQVHSYSPNVHVLGDLDLFADFLKKDLSHYQHWVGATAALVDGRLRVRGAPGLRVADASVLGSPPAHTDGPARLVGWRAAGFALADHKLASIPGTAAVGDWPPPVMEHNEALLPPPLPIWLAPFAAAGLSTGEAAPRRHLGEDAWGQPVAVPLVGLGTGTSVWADDGAAARAVATWLRLGGRHLDTALEYRNLGGVGRGLAMSGVRREEVFITSKIPPSNMGYVSSREAAEAILEQLGVDYVDLLLIHWPGTAAGTMPAGPEVPGCFDAADGWGACRLETWTTLEELFLEGRARAIGVSNFEEKHLEEMQRWGVRLPRVNQIEFHPWQNRGDLLALCSASGIEVVAYGSLGGNRHAGEVLGDAFLQEAAMQLGKSPAQVLLRWALNRGVAVIPSTDKEHRMMEYLDLFGFELSTATQAALDTLAVAQVQTRFFSPDPREIM